jgi:hypothetical protein
MSLMKLFDHTGCSVPGGRMETETEPIGYPTDEPAARPAAYGLSLDEIQEAAGADWEHVAQNPAALEALALSVATDRLLEQGVCPAHFTATTLCRECGPVYTWPGTPEMVEGCVWCRHRLVGRPVPRPPKPPGSADIA